MEPLKTYVSEVKFDEEKRIIIALKPQYEQFLKAEKTRQLLKKAAADILGSDFVRLEIGRYNIRITVAQGTEEANLNKVQKELADGIDLIMRLMGL